MEIKRVNIKLFINGTHIADADTTIKMEDGLIYYNRLNCGLIHHDKQPVNEHTAGLSIQRPLF